MEPQKSSIGGIIGTIIIIALIILGGLYFWGKRVEESKATQAMTSDNSQASADNQNSNVANVSSSDDLNSIQTDLNGSNFNNLDTEMNTQASN